jgi:hypothetical protein
MGADDVRRPEEVLADQLGLTEWYGWRGQQYEDEP